MLIPSLSQEDPLEEGIKIHFSILAWRIPKHRGAWWATVHEVSKESNRTWQLLLLLLLLLLSHLSRV